MPATAPHAALSEALGHAPADKRLEVLRRVAETGSISQAARDAGISYKAAWQAIDTLSNLSGQTLVERTVGGSGGGGARITPQGLQLLALADELMRAREAVLSRFSGGAALPMGLGLRTSMRNQLPCRVEAVEPLGPQDPAVRVRLRTPGRALLTSNITRESADLLALAAGLEVLVLCKATAVRVVRGAVGTGPGQCVLHGRIERLARGQDRDEVVLALEGGGQWVGFADHPFAARRGQRATAAMSSSALVVGLAG
ncbi:TOBE domain-containing protein [Hydrogenophaga pseudoflava]|uniref:TOBE domain-containing protein n=1 Tax=Hydrogenophaga pseudoflava TaxID=47421 RepID=UPI0027E4A9B6|nr:TOBE domain-containing protein [Hydrogenophaga pseudoflava]MDQ7745588.1 LysR family transcriptional regulator [Hydrogenophaga pseudoflava]